MGIILPLNKPIPPLVAISTPGLNGQRLVLIIFVTGLLVGFFEKILDRFGGRERPENQSFEKSELSQTSISKSQPEYQGRPHYPLNRCHAGECASTVHRVLSIPRGRPLRLMRLNSFFERTLKVTTSGTLKRVR